MKTIKVIAGKSGENVGAYLPEVAGFLITSKNIKTLQQELPEALKFHVASLPQAQEWLSQEWHFEYRFADIPSFLEAFSNTLNQSLLARISGINESLMRQYVSGARRPSAKVMEKIEYGVKKYASQLSQVKFA